MTEQDYITAFRFGFGIAPNKIFDPAQELAKPPTDDATLNQKLSDRITTIHRLQRAYKEGGRLIDDKKQLQAMLHQHEVEDLHGTIVNAVTSDDMFTNRLAEFWTNHFSLGRGAQILRVAGGLFEQALRPKLFRKFSDLLVAAELHPAMIYYLNLQDSIGPNSLAGKRKGKGFNENLGREILELHTLGVNGGYTQDDVVALSKILTGWHVAKETGEVQFNPKFAEPGSKILLGKSYGGSTASSEDATQAFAALAYHPATAQFICAKLAHHFFGPQSENAAKAMTAVFRSTEGDLSAVYSTMLGLKQARAPIGTQSRSDFAFLVSALRVGLLRKNALAEKQKNDGTPKANKLTVQAMHGLTQQLWQAPSPKGWPDDPAFWLSPTVITARLKRIPTIISAYEDEDPVIFAERTLGPLLTANTRSTLKLASSRPLAHGLALASPEFNRR
jgi:uncharacterized protein (DUF1800 family)